MASFLGLGIGNLQVFFGVTFKIDFFGGLPNFSVFFGGYCKNRKLLLNLSCFYLVSAALFLLCISSVPLK